MPQTQTAPVRDEPGLFAWFMGQDGICTVRSSNNLWLSDILGQNFASLGYPVLEYAGNIRKRLQDVNGSI